MDENELVDFIDNLITKRISEQMVPTFNIPQQQQIDGKELIDRLHFEIQQDDGYGFDPMQYRLIVRDNFSGYQKIFPLRLRL